MAETLLQCSMDKIILTDCDGVLLDWDSGFDRFMQHRGYIRKPNTEHHYRLALRYDGVSDLEIRDLVEEMNTTEWVANLAPMRDSVEYVTRLKSEGYEFIVITAMSDSPDAARHRAANLDAVFGPGVFSHDKMICIKPLLSKSSALMNWQGQGHFWIEDHFMHAESGYELGLSSILIDQPYNKQYSTSLFPRVSTWSEIYRLVKHREAKA